MKKRKYDIIILGATGFTGKLVVEYLMMQYGISDTLRWAIAGRNPTKLEDVKKELGLVDLPVILVDINDGKALDIMTKSTKVVCTTVGPYARYGTGVVASCVKNHTHYCDLSGEVQWMKRMIDDYHHEAKNNQVRIVHSCGFDSIPSDLGVFYLQQEAIQRFQEYCYHIKCRVKAAKGGFSGGTFASLNNVLEEAAIDPKVKEVLLDPYGLNPEGMKEGRDKRDLGRVIFDKDLNSWISPFVMANINTKNVRRSHALKDFPYGKDFIYDEAVMTGRGISGKIKAWISTFGIGLMMNAKKGSFLKKILDRFLPDPGEGPDQKTREEGFFNFVLYGKLSSDRHLQARVIGDMDPGYGSTSKMLGESAVCLALDEEILPDYYGVLTPSVAMGDALLKRLVRNAGITFRIDK